MASTLVFRLVGPMQSWGTRSRFSERDTEKEPTKSGVVGLLCAALGRSRSADLDDVVALRMGVRVDREGLPSRDFHTAQGVLKANKKPRQLAGADLGEIRKHLRGPATLSNRYFLADAAFLVGLEGEETLLGGLHEALRRPRWPTFLGRKSFVPSAPIHLPNGLVTGKLEQTLARFPWLGPDRRRDRPERLRTVIEVPFMSDGMARRDTPTSFAERRYLDRRIQQGWVSTPTEILEGCS